MARVALVLLRWRVKADALLSRFFGWIAVSLWPVAYFVPQHLINIHHHVPVGTYIAVMGGLAAAVALRKDPSLWEKSAWIVLITFVMVAEIRNLYIADAEQQGIFGGIQSGLNETKSGLDSTVNGLSNAANALGTISGDIHKASEENQRHSKQTLSALNDSHEQDEREFAGIIDQEKEVLKSQQEISEQFAGRLVPGDTPTPANACDHLMQDPRTPILPNTTTLLYPEDSAALTDRLPSSIIEIGKTPVVAFDQKPHSPEIYISVDFRDVKNRILVRVNKNGMVDRTPELSVLRPDKSTLLIEDGFGQEFFRAEFLNPHAFQISGRIVYCGKSIEIKNLSPFNKGSCTAYVSGSALAIAGMTCPTQP